MTKKECMRVNDDDLEIEITTGGWSLCYYNGELFTGEAFELDSKGEILLSESHYIKGTEWGITKIWYDTRQLEYQTNYYLGQKHGEALQWFENGQLKSKECYKMGARLRKEEYDENGNLISICKIEDHPKAFEHLNDWKKMNIVFKYVDSEYLPIVTYIVISSIDEIKELLLSIQKKKGIMHEYYGFEFGENNTLTFHDFLSKKNITLLIREFITFFEPWLNNYFAKDPNEKAAIETLLKNIQNS
jgi:hypothetical protein